LAPVFFTPPNASSDCTNESFERSKKINEFVTPKQAEDSSMLVWVRLHSGKFWWKLSRSQSPGPALPG
jgi:hypothetical protein